jgi:hypothetical protein
MIFLFTMLFHVKKCMNSVTIKTGMLEDIGRNSFRSSVKPDFCCLRRHSCRRRRRHHHHHHIPYIIRSNHLKVQFFFLRIHVIQKFFPCHLCPFLRNILPICVFSRPVCRQIRLDTLLVID